jgi:DNA-binding MurR/RpiR family transcriptional regulator
MPQSADDQRLRQSGEIPSAADRLRENASRLTRAERQLAQIILDNYPVSGLGSMTTLAKNADVSTPTVVRLVQKLGYGGFPDFQADLRRELEARISGPVAKHDTWAEQPPEGHVLTRFTDAVIANIRNTVSQIDVDAFDRACELLTMPEHRLYVVGGRITRSMADYFFLHMQVIRPNVTHIQSNSNAWPHYLLDVNAGDLVVIFDIRRYETSTLKLAEMARARGAKLILFTDQWQSPVNKLSEFSFASRVIVPSAWDSTAAMMLTIEAMIAEIQERTWATTRERMEALEEMFDQTRFFRKFT